MSDDKIIDLRERVAAKEAANPVTTSYGDDGRPANKIYNVILTTGEVLEGYGILMVNGSFFAVGVPTEDGLGVDFSLAVPIGNVRYVEVSETFDEEEVEG